MQTKQGTGMICDMIFLEGMSRPKGPVMQIKPSTAMSRLDNDGEAAWAGAASLRSKKASFSSCPRAL
jgi:hypothetical protein